MRSEEECMFIEPDKAMTAPEMSDGSPMADNYNSSPWPSATPLVLTLTAQRECWRTDVRQWCSYFGKMLWPSRQATSQKTRQEHSWSAINRRRRDSDRRPGARSVTHRANLQCKI